MTHFFDSHCHLDPWSFGEERDDVITRARDAGVKLMTTIGSDATVEYANAAVELARKEPDIFATVGIHPHNAVDCDDAVFEQIASLAADPNVVAIGETGLDYHYDTSPRPVQQAVFRRFIQLAHTLNKALVIHVRSAFEDCLRILKEENAESLNVVIHCFSGTKENARDALALGCWLAIPGIVTFKKSGDIPEVVASMPIEKLLLETDCPYLAPVPKRGKRNEPAYLVHTAAKVAELRGMELTELAEITVANTKSFYGLE